MLYLAFYNLVTWNLDKEDFCVGMYGITEQKHLSQCGMWDVLGNVKGK